MDNPTLVGSAVFALFVIAGFLGIIGEARSARRQLDSRLEAMERVLTEIRDRLPPPVPPPPAPPAPPPPG